MVSDWEEVVLGDYVDHQKGYIFKSKDYQDEGELIVRVSDFTDRSIDISSCNRIDKLRVDEFESVKLNAHDVIIATVGSWPKNPASIVGKTVSVPKDAEGALLNQNAVRLRAINGVEQRFLFFLLKNKAFQSYIISTAQGSANQASITLRDIFRYSFKLPPLSEQKAIAHILGSLDDKIELNRQMNDTLEAMAQALFKSWFVDFDPVIDNALAAGNDIPDEFAERAEQRKGIEKKDNADIQSLFPDEFEFTEEMGWIPKGWSVGVVEDVVKRLKSKKSYNKKDVLEHGEVPVYEQGAKILLGYHNNEPDIEAQINEPAFIFGDHTCVNKLSLEPFSISSNVIPLIGKLYPTLWVYYAVKDKQSFEEYRRHWMEFIIKSVILPSLKVTELFSENIKSFQVKQMKMQHQNSDLAKLRDTLLPKLMSGELRIPDAEALVDEVL